MAKRKAVDAPQKPPAKKTSAAKRNDDASVPSSTTSSGGEDASVGTPVPEIPAKKCATLPTGIEEEDNKDDNEEEDSSSAKSDSSDEEGKVGEEEEEEHQGDEGDEEEELAPVPKPASIPDDVSVNSVSSKVSVKYESSDSYDSDFEEVNEIKIQKLWCNYVHYFVLNKDHRTNGYGKFPYHFAAYLFYRNDSKECGKFNPTLRNAKKIHEMTSHRQQEVTEFLRDKLKMNHKLQQKVLACGDALCFKRSLTKTKVKGVYIVPCQSFLKIKQRLHITAF